MKRFLALVLIPGAVAAGGPQPPSPQALTAEIESKGARAVVVRIWSDNELSEVVGEAIETADPEWLEIARLLKSGSDAGASLSLNYSVARALPKEPERVLALVGKGFSVDNICTSPFIEPERGEAEQYQRRTIRALKKVTAPGLLVVRDECLAEVSAPLRVQ